MSGKGGEQGEKTGSGILTKTDLCGAAKRGDSGWAFERRIKKNVEIERIELKERAGALQKGNPLNQNERLRKFGKKQTKTVGGNKRWKKTNNFFVGTAKGGGGGVCRGEAGVSGG